MTECLNSIKDSFQDKEPKVLISQLQSSFLNDIPIERLNSLLPVLEASVTKYCEERNNNKIEHVEACDLALNAGRVVFSTTKQKLPSLSSSLPPSNNENKAEENTSSIPSEVLPSSSTPFTMIGNDSKPLPTSAATPSNDSNQYTDEDKKKWRAPKVRSKGKRRHRPNPIPQSKLMISGLSSQYEEAEIGGGTMYTTEVSLYEDGTVELGNHDIGQRGRQVRIHYLFLTSMPTI